MELNISIGEKISKALSGKYGEKSFDHAKKFATDILRTDSKRKKIIIKRIQKERIV